MQVRIAYQKISLEELKKIEALFPGKRNEIADVRQKLETKIDTFQISAENPAEVGLKKLEENLRAGKLIVAAANEVLELFNNFDCRAAEAEADADVLLKSILEASAVLLN